MTPELLKAGFIFAAAVIFTGIMKYRFLLRLPIMIYGKLDKKSQ